MNTIIYIHGLRSNSNSTKYRHILARYPEHNVQCLEWSEDSNMHEMLQSKSAELENSSANLTIVGDSTGANFAVQLHDLLMSKYKWSNLVLINPLLTIDSVKIDLGLSSEFLKYIVDCKPKSFYAIVSTNDDVIDNSNLQGLSNTILIDDCHKASNEQSLSAIESTIELTFIDLHI